MVYIVLNSLAIFNILVMCVFLIFRKNNTLPNYLLALTFVIPGLYFFDNLLVTTGLIFSVPYFFFFVQILANLFPVAIYIYVHLLIGDSRRFRPFLIAASAVTLLFSVCLLFYFVSLPADQQTTYIRQLDTAQYPLSMNMYNIVFYCCQMIYLVVLFKEIKVYKQSVISNLSETESVKVLFVTQFVALVGILNFILVVFYILLPANIVDYGVLPVVVTIIYVFIIIFSIKNNAIFSHDTYRALLTENKKMIVNIKSADEPEEVVKDERWLNTITTLEKLMKEEQVFKQNTLNLTTLSELAGEQPYLVSQVLNQHFGKSFFDFINEARVEEAKELLKNFDAKVNTIENVAAEVGFNSRASFYRSFKKITGKNPGDFVSLN